jgi:hypothetical protein
MFQARPSVSRFFNMPLAMTIKKLIGTISGWLGALDEAYVISRGSFSFAVLVPRIREEKSDPLPAVTQTFPIHCR